MRAAPAHGRDWAAFTLALGLVFAINVITVAVLADALFSEGQGLSENATQILNTAFGGVIGVLGSYIGYQSARRVQDEVTDNYRDLTDEAERLSRSRGKPMSTTTPDPQNPNSDPDHDADVEADPQQDVPDEPDGNGPQKR